MSHSKQRWFSQFSVQAIGILIANLIPLAGLLLTTPSDQVPNLVSITFVCCLAAAFMGMYLLGGVIRYPGVAAAAFIVPAISFAYGLLFFVFIMWRLEYSRLLLFGSYILVVAWFFAINSWGQRKSNLRIGVVPEGKYQDLLDHHPTRWVVLRSVNADVSELSAVAVDLRANLANAWERRLADYALLGLPVYHTKQLLESITGRVDLEHISENSFGTLSPQSAYMTVKHIIDWVFALAAILILFPVLVIISTLIVLDSKGGPLFKQVRVGYCGKPFVVYKFRTMIANGKQGADTREEAITCDADDRVTRIGRILRRTRLDEFPQLINVLRLEMSWIGPRPEAEILSKWYEREIPFYRYRHIVRPGLTGWAQVNQGHVSDVLEVKSKLDYDLYYIKHFSPWIDFLIVGRTIKTMLTGFGSR
jgi:lipopolysaccharide/colanic/teichoic acid biosynthesis glycosyltransferase